jgi:hypothetical protein
MITLVLQSKEIFLSPPAPTTTTKYVSYNFQRHSNSNSYVCTLSARKCFRYNEIKDQ